MILRYRVSLSGIKGFARVYELKSDMTLYEFHKLLRDELEFPHDQQIQFKALDETGGLVARYALFNLGAGAVDEVTLNDTVEKGIASFVYFYDVTNRKSVIITFEGEAARNPELVYPALVETKGPNPIEFENGYVAFEDLPDEQKHLRPSSSWSKGADLDDDEDMDFDDEDDADSDDDDDDAEEIYDENEEGIF